MIEKKNPETLDDTDLDHVEGAGLMDTEPGTFGFEPITLERGIRKPKGITHDTEFEN